jgi:hypothetical protein
MRNFITFILLLAALALLVVLPVPGVRILRMIGFDPPDCVHARMLARLGFDVVQCTCGNCSAPMPLPPPPVRPQN